MPPLRLVESALRQATEAFAAELASPGNRSPEWGELEWTMAKAAAVLHGVAPLLAASLHWQGPPEWRRFVEQQNHHTLLRHRRIEALLACMDEATRRQGIAALALKGAALHALGLYCAGQRPMADIDLLVRERDVQPMLRVLQSLGYQQTSATWKHRILEPQRPAAVSRPQAQYALGEHSEAAIKIELHTRIAERLPVIEVDATECIVPSEPRPGLVGYPSTAALLMHLLLHAAGNMVVRTLRLIHLHDIALLTARMNDAQWAQWLRSRVDHRSAWWAVPPLELAARYYPHSIPSEVLAELRPECPRALRALSRRQTLSDVSYAALDVEAFPGLGWAASLSEKWRCILARIRPGADWRVMRELVRAEPWSATGASPRQSLGRRGLRILLTRPPRPASMYIVRAALASMTIHEIRSTPSHGPL
ncbi:MAG TPA: nucleotidyltransferase family protein [Steroidobacteraceae bacterium]|jgi:hypothetical protein|nr:nucleotidyltransferase family protein [Steroidobacteraceae bacterium]